MTRPRQKRRGRPFIQLFRNVKRSQAYFDLDVFARAALIEILDRYTGINNGLISISVRELAEALGYQKSRAAKALCDLDDSGLAHPTSVRKWPSRKAVTWRLTLYRCDASGEPPVMNWPARHSALADRMVREGGLKEPHSPPGRTQKQKNPMNRSRHSPPGRTHIDVHHRVNGSQVGALVLPERKLDPSSLCFVG